MNGVDEGQMHDKLFEHGKFALLINVDCCVNQIASRMGWIRSPSLSLG